MRRRAKFTPYIRQRRASDRSESIRVAIQMEFYGADCYVIVQRGYPHLAIGAARTKRELLKTIFALHFHNAGFTGRHFRAWAKRVGAYARGDAHHERKRAEADAD